MSDPWPDVARRLTDLANGCDVTGLDHLPVVSRANAKTFASDLRHLLARAARVRELEAGLRPFANPYFASFRGPVVEVCEPHPRNPSGRIEPRATESFANARALLAGEAEQ